MSLKDPVASRVAARKRAAIVMADRAAPPTTTGGPVGFWRSGPTHAHRVFTEVGCEVEAFGPDGGGCEADALSDPDEPSGHGKSDRSPELQAPVDYATGVADIDVARFDAIVVAGGQAPMLTLEPATDLHAEFAERDEHAMPRRIEGRAKEIGAHDVQAGLRRGFALRDGDRVTGQPNLSGEETARPVAQAPGRRGYA